MGLTAVLLLLLLVGGAYLYFQLDDKICSHVEQLVSKHYKHLIVEVGSARFEQGRGVYINRLTLAEPRAGDRPQSILSIDELFLACDGGLEELIAGKPRLKQIVVRRPRLRAVRQADGRWNVASLLPPPKFSDDTPELFIEDATLILEDASRHSATPLSVRGVDIKLTPDASTGAADAHGRTLIVSGVASGAPARELTFSGTLSCDDGTMNLTLSTRGLEVSPELIAAVPGPLPEPVAAAELYASADATLQLVRRQPGGPLDWSADVMLSRGRLDHELLAQPLAELAAHVVADTSSLAIKQLSGKLGPANVTLALNRNGWSESATLSLAGRVSGLTIDSDIPLPLPPRIQEIRQRFRPAGIVDAEVALTFDGHEWRPELKAECRSLSLTDMEKFPYPIEGAAGTVALTRSEATGATRFDLELVGNGGGRPIRITAGMDGITLPKISLGMASQGVTLSESPAAAEGVQLASAGMPVPRRPTGWVEVTGTAVPIHEQLLAAIPGRSQAFVRSLRPQGLVDFRFRYERLDPAAERGETSLDLNLVDCAIQYERFPYPLQQIRGKVMGRNDRYTLTDIVGRDRQGAAEVVCQGQSEASPAGLALALAIRGTNVPLDENLKQSLEPRVQQVWADLRPQGRINFLANVVHQPGQEKPTIRVDIQPHERSVSVEPTFFPYRFEQVDGLATVTDGRVDFQQLKGVHGRTTFNGNGIWQAAAGGGWQLVLSGLNVDRLAFDPDFLRAVPLGVLKVLDRARPVGNFNVNNSQLVFNRRPESPQIAATWDVRLAFHQAALRGDVPLENLSGAVQLRGDCDGPNYRSYGELNIDSMIWNDIQFTNIRGPFLSDSTYSYLGQLAASQLGQPPRRVNADVYGGTISADATLQHTGQPRYTTSVSIGAVDLGRIARERLGAPSDLTGTVSGTMTLSGAGRSTYSLTGNGDLHVVDANIYQLPPLVAMLKMLRNRSPNTTAFNRCDAQFELTGEHIHFQQLNLLGDAVSLYGRGETNFDRRLNLVFYTLVGPVDLPIPLWKTVAGHLSEQGLQLKVDGTWDNPQIHREAFPAVTQMLDQLRTEAGQGAAAVAPPAAAALPWAASPR